MVQPLPPNFRPQEENVTYEASRLAPLNEKERKSIKSSILGVILVVFFLIENCSFCGFDAKTSRPSV